MRRILAVTAVLLLIGASGAQASFQVDGVLYITHVSGRSEARSTLQRTAEFGGRWTVSQPCHTVTIGADPCYTFGRIDAVGDHWIAHERTSHSEFNDPVAIVTDAGKGRFDIYKGSPPKLVATVTPPQGPRPPGSWEIYRAYRFGHARRLGRRIGYAKDFPGPPVIPGYVVAGGAAFFSVL